MVLALLMEVVKTICSIIEATCMVVLVFELNPWKRKE
jgi:hypothetical protein